ncbi:MAG: hypothetical protein KGJ49_01465 [Alphaproteobacteria bacterium]|nr:hypothetical protein [Alphaproteobacteria bacterium]
MTHVPPSEMKYDVGYGKPPKDRQFKPGQSGNPNGTRKKKSPAMASIMQAAFAERVRIRVNGKSKTVTRKELMIEQLVAKTLKSDRRALKRLLKLRDYVEAAGEMEPVVIRMSKDLARAVALPDWEARTAHLIASS